MMLLTALLLAMQAGGADSGPGQADGPKLLNRGEILRPEDYPTDSARLGEVGAVEARITVSAEGKPTACEIATGSGYAKLDAAACRSVMKRARFAPAVDGTGKPVTASIISRFGFSIPTAAQPVEYKDMLGFQIGVPDIPPGYVRPVALDVEFNAAGKPVICRIKLSSGNADVDVAACELTMQKVTNPPMKGVARAERGSARVVVIKLAKTGA